MPIAYAYCRFSSAAQADGDSIRRQTEAAERYAADHRLTLDTSLKDYGVSAYSGDNRTKGALGDFLEAVKTGQVRRGSFLLVDSLDRLSREGVGEAVAMLSAITKAGIKVVTLNNRNVLDSNSDLTAWIIHLVELDRSHRESDEKGRKVAAAHAQSKNAAREVGRIWHGSGPSWMELDDKRQRWKLKPAQVALVRRVFAELDAGLGTTAIARKLNAEGIATPKHGKGWHHSTVLELGKNRAVLGEYQPQRMVKGSKRGREPDGKPALDYYPRIISDELFYRVQARIRSRNTRAGRGGGRTGKTFTNLFMHIGQCGHCEAVMGAHRATKARGGRVVLKCSNAARSHKCEHNYRIDYDRLETCVLDYIAEIDPTSALGETKRDLPVARLTSQRDDIESRLDRLVEVLEMGGPAVDRYRALLAEKAVVEEELAVAQAGETTGTVEGFTSHQGAVSALRERMRGADEETLYETRAKLHAEMRSVIDTMLVFEHVTCILLKGGETHYFLAHDPKGFTTSELNTLEKVRVAMEGPEEVKPRGRTLKAA